MTKTPEQLSIITERPSTLRIPGGKSLGDKWIVILESKLSPDGYRHRCGQMIETASIVLDCIRKEESFFIKTGQAQQIEVPYCPDCEHQPNGGTVDQKGKITLYLATASHSSQT